MQNVPRVLVGCRQEAGLQKTMLLQIPRQPRPYFAQGLGRLDRDGRPDLGREQEQGRRRGPHRVHLPCARARADEYNETLWLAWVGGLGWHGFRSLFVGVDLFKRHLPNGVPSRPTQEKR